MRVFTILKLLAGRVKFGDGWLQVGDILMQWGVVQVTAPPGSKDSPSQAFATINFTKRFTSYPTVVSMDNFGWAYNNSLGLRTREKGYVEIGVLSPRDRQTSIAIHWLAIGSA